MRDFILNIRIPCNGQWGHLTGRDSMSYQNSSDWARKTHHHTLECRYNAVQCTRILHTSLQELEQIINQRLNPQNHAIPHPDRPWGVFREYLGDNWLRYNGTALYICTTAVCPISPKPLPEPMWTYRQLGLLLRVKTAPGWSITHLSPGSSTSQETYYFVHCWGCGNGITIWNYIW